MSEDVESQPDLELAKISREIGELQQRLLELPPQLRASRYWRAVHYFLLQAQGSIGSLVLQRSRARSRKGRRS